jgi:hypothetical protein
MNRDYDDIHTGDVILLSSITPFSVLVRWGIGSEFNHVGVCIRIDESVLPEIKIKRKNGLLCVLEFNGDDFVNVLTNKIHYGNRLIKLSDMYDKYKRIAYRKLNRKYYSREFKEKVRNFIIKYCYDTSSMDMVTPAFNALFGLELKNDDIDYHPTFCSELSAKFYGDIIPGTITTNYKNLLPHHFLNKKYDHLFETGKIDVKNEYHYLMDFFHSKVFWLIIFFLLFLLIVLFIFLGNKVYKKYYITRKKL